MVKGLSPSRAQSGRGLLLFDINSLAHWHQFADHKRQGHEQRRQNHARQRKGDLDSDGVGDRREDAAPPEQQDQDVADNDG